MSGCHQVRGPKETFSAHVWWRKPNVIKVTLPPVGQGLVSHGRVGGISYNHRVDSSKIGANPVVVVSVSATRQVASCCS